MAHSDDVTPDFSTAPVLFTEAITVEPYLSKEEVWLVLAGLESWSAWATEISTVTHLDELPCGRGSRINCKGSFGEEQWTIRYWLPEERLDLYQATGGIRQLRRFSLLDVEAAKEEGQTDGGIKLQLSYYCQASPASKLLAAMTLRRAKTRSAKLFADLTAHLCTTSSHT